MPRIVKVKALSRYKLWIEFKDGKAGEVDLADLAGKGVFGVWHKPGEFEKVQVDIESGTVCWPGGIDLCPDQLYHDVTGAALPGETAMVRK